MKLKISTGYLTPQLKKSNAARSRRLSVSRNEERQEIVFDEDLFQNLLKCPKKKNMVLRLLEMNKKAIQEYKKTCDDTHILSPCTKLKEKPCESPTELYRRRALEKMVSSPSVSNRSDCSRPSSRNSELSSHTSNGVYNDKVLEDVTAYVEIRSRLDEDRSAGVKAVLKSLGAKVVDRFSRDVTHVIFKDGSYKTFQKAKLMKIHLVSILWVELCRKTMIRQNEKEFPAMRSGFDDETIVCSQMQKEYENIIREEYRSSLINGTPLPHSGSLINRRRTLMTPLGSNVDSGSQDITDLEVDLINSFGNSHNGIDDSIQSSTLKEGSFAIPKRATSRKISSILKSSENTHSLDMELTNIPDGGPILLKNARNSNFNTFENSFMELKTSTRSRRRRTICNSLIPSAFSPENNSDNIFNNSSKVHSKTSNISISDNDCNSGNNQTTDLLMITDQNVKQLSRALQNMSTLCSESKTLIENENNRSLNLAELDSSNDSEILVPRRIVKSIDNNTPLRKSVLGSKDSAILDVQKESQNINDSANPENKLGRFSPRRSTRKTVAENKPKKQEPKVTDKKNITEFLSNTIVKEKSKSSETLKYKGGLRKLYNPDDYIQVEIDDEQERAEKRRLAKKRKSDEGVYINPVDLIRSAKETPPKETDNLIILENAKRTRRAVKQKEISHILSSSADEQKELLNEVINEKNNNILRVQQYREKSEQLNITHKHKKPSQSTCTSQNDLKLTKTSGSGVVQRNRRSTLDFVHTPFLTSSKKQIRKKSEKTSLPSIVCTKLHRGDVQVFSQIVKKLGGFIIEDEVSNRTTHVIAGESKRTINLLRGIARGCWILKNDWVLQSLEEGKWLPEEKFEVDDFSPVIQRCRIERQAFGPNYRMDVFESCPPIYVAPSTVPRCSDLKELITTCKGKVVSSPRMAKIIVGQYLKQEETVCVTEKWVLDCMTFYKKIHVKSKYVLNDKRKSLAV